MVHIKCYDFKDVYTIMSFKILNNMIVRTLLDPRNKILIMKWTKWKRTWMKSISLTNTKCLYWQTQTYPLYISVTKFFLASLIVFDPFSTPYHRNDALLIWEFKIKTSAMQIHKHKYLNSSIYISIKHKNNLAKLTHVNQYIS